MKEKFLPFILGFISTLIIILLAGWYFGRPGQVERPSFDIVDENSLDQLKQAISQLNNYGDLPKNVDSGSMGKANPFE